MDEQNRGFNGNFSEKEPHERRDVHENNQNKSESTAFYYSYGPYSSKRMEERKEKETLEVEVSSPNSLRPYSSGDSVQSDAVSRREHGGPVVRPGTWHYSYPSRRGFSLKAMLASFLAGALVIGSLMFFSDKMNWFTDEALSAVPPSVSERGGETVEVTKASGEVVRPNTIADIVQKASPAVVKIESYATGSSSRSSNPFFRDDIFRYWFGEEFFSTPNDNNNSNRRVMLGMGSGFIFDQEGYILTNEHVIHGANEIYVTVEGYEEPFKAELLGSDFDLDLAVLKIKGNKPFPTLKLGDSSKVRVGDWVTAIGNPKGFDHSVSVGVLSAKDREFTIADTPRPRNYRNMLQTDASINPGNSGGPLLNLNGDVIGINTAVSTEAQGIGFAISANEVTKVLEPLKKNKKIPKPWIGISLMNIQPAWVEDLNLDSAEGVLIQGIYENSPAQKAGLQVYDVIVKVNGQKVKNSDELIRIVGNSKVGDKLTLTIVRDGKTLTTVVILGDQNAN